MNTSMEGDAKISLGMLQWVPVVLYMPMLFPLGQLVATPNALAHLTHDDIIHALRRHVYGDWGDLDDEDKETNTNALKHGARLLSAYHTSDGTKFWIITEADRSVTTVLLPEDY